MESYGKKMVAAALKKLRQRQSVASEPEATQQDQIEQLPPGIILVDSVAAQHCACFLLFH